MASLNKLACASGYKNTGVGKCYLDPKNIIGGALVPIDWSLTPSQVASFITNLMSAAAADDPYSRIYPIQNFVAVTPNTEDKTIQTFGYGGKSVVREGDYDWTFQFTYGGLCLSNALRTFNSNGAWAWIFWDSQYVVYGTQGSNGNFKGIPLKMNWQNPWNPNDGSNVTSYMFQVVFEPYFINEGLSYVQSDATLLGVKGLIDLELNLQSYNNTTHIAAVQVLDDCSGVDIGAIYATELGDDALWLATNAANGNPITITTVARVGDHFNLTFDNTDTDFPASGGKILLSLAAPSVLKAADIVGYESNEIPIAIP